MGKKDMAEIRVFVPPELRQRFKGKCVTQGKTMSDVIAAFMENYAKDDSKEGKEAS
ncbi:plasmid partition protein ParG [Nostoc sp.]|uniref:plasmid partition protein ParG n=1 Tax=Nostoc sp. TaxID=1180 RepID=UPI00359334A0